LIQEMTHMRPSNDRHRKMTALTRTVGTAIAAAGLLFTSAASAAASGAAEGAGHPVANVALDQSGCGLIPLDVELIIDRSGSMGSNSSDGHPRMYWAQHAADQLVDSLDANGGVGTDQNHRVGVTSFHNTTAHVDLALDGASAAAVKAAIDGLSSSGNTPLAAGMAAGADDMTANGRDTDFGLTVQHVIIILSDGRPWPDGAPARPSAGQISSFKGSADSIYSIAIGQGGTAGTANEVDLALMASLAKPASGYFNVATASDLPALFADIFSSIACRPGIQVDKSADTASLPAGGGNVTYNYDVTNVGNVALSNVSVSDDKCSPVTYGSGDSDHDHKLDLTETWTFTCTANLTKTTTNVATATGWHGDTKVEDDDQATVKVADPTPTPPATPSAPPSEGPCGCPTPTPTPSQCGCPTPTPSSSPSDEPSTSPSASPSESASPSDSTTNPPTDPPTATPTASPSDSGGVGGETGTPGVTPPSTSTVAGADGTSGTSPLLLVLALAALTIGVLYATPRPARRTVHVEIDED
jgi:von Willebrand factor type A domain